MTSGRVSGNKLNFEFGLLGRVEKSTRLSVAASARCTESEFEPGGWIQFIRHAICRSYTLFWLATTLPHLFSIWHWSLSPDLIGTASSCKCKLALKCLLKLDLRSTRVLMPSYPRPLCSAFPVHVVGLHSSLIYLSSGISTITAMKSRQMEGPSCLRCIGFVSVTNWPFSESTHNAPPCQCTFKNQ
jgi:hypothetical protein